MNLGFLFPGQGSQSLGMGKFLYNEFSCARQVFEEASTAIKLDIKKLCFDSSDSELAKTENTQPAIVTVSRAVQVVLNEELGLKPSVCAGHSVGEYAAFVAAEVFDFSTAVKAVRLRGEAMQSAVPLGVGGMVATLGLNEAQARGVCEWVNSISNAGRIEPANFNCDGQIVLSGHLTALNWLREQFKPQVLVEKGLAADAASLKRVKFIPLQVSAPFHCSLMKPAEEKMAQFFETTKFHDANIPVIQNFTAQAVTSAQDLKSNLIRQISGSVLWTQSMQTLIVKFPAPHLIEVGSGQVLKGLLKKISPETPFFSANSKEDLKLIAQTFSRSV